MTSWLKVGCVRRNELMEFYIEQVLVLLVRLHLLRQHRNEFSVSLVEELRTLNRDVQTCNATAADNMPCDTIQPPQHIDCTSRKQWKPILAVNQDVIDYDTHNDVTIVASGPITNLSARGLSSSQIEASVALQVCEERASFPWFLDELPRESCRQSLSAPFPAKPVHLHNSCALNSIC